MVSNRTALDPRKEIPNDIRRKLVRAGGILPDMGCIPTTRPEGSTSTRRTWGALGEPVDLAWDKRGDMASSHTVSGRGRMGEDRVGNHCNRRRMMNSNRRGV